MNVYDGERMAEMLGARGHVAAADGADADLVVLNTCHIREKAAEKVYSDIGRLKRATTAARPMIAVAGCVAQAEGAEIARRAPSVDVVVGPQAYHRLPDLVARAARGENGGRYRHARRSASSARCPRARAGQRPTAFLTVQEGCDKFCTYCVVPYTRGAEISRPFARSDRRSAARWSTGGAREITCSGRTSTRGTARTTRAARSGSTG